MSLWGYLQEHGGLSVSYVTAKPHPSMGDNSGKLYHCCPHPSQPPLTPNSTPYAHRVPLSSGLRIPKGPKSRCPEVPGLQGGLMWERWEEVVTTS